MPCTPMAVDAFGRRVPSWIAGRVASMSSSGPAVVECLSMSQRLQLGSWASSELPGSFDNCSYISFAEVNGGGRIAGAPMMSRACLTSTREHCRVSMRRGDTLPEVDFASHLSCRGVSCSVHQHETERLSDVASTHKYIFPFWLSRQEVEWFCVRPLHAARHNLDALTRAELDSLFNSEDAAPTITNDRGIMCRVVNLDELQKKSSSSTRDSRSFSFFRKYAPINVATHLPFTSSIEDRLRLECVCSRCWCSLWGTPEDFSKIGVATLTGAIGLNVVDSLGNDIFITNALCTHDPAKAYSFAYPHKSISFTS